MRGVTLDGLVGAVPDLPALPTAVATVLKETGSGSATSSSVADAILSDPGIAARVLRLANSAFYGLSREVGRVQDAVVVLGFRTVRSLVLVAGTYPLLKRPLESYRLDGEEMWGYAGAVAVGAQTVAQRSGTCDPDEAFGCGLLHDIGRLALDESLGDRLPLILRSTGSGETSFDEAERLHLGFDHGEVGAHMARGWNLPPSYIAAMHYHHRPEDASEHAPIVDAVHLGVALALAMGYGLGIDGLGHRLSPDAMERLKLDGAGFERLAADFTTNYAKHAPLLAAAA